MNSSYFLLLQITSTYGRNLSNQGQNLNQFKYLLSDYFLVALYFVAVSTIAAIVGQVLVRKLVALLGRASLIIFILSATIFVSAISLGKCH